MKNKLWPIVMIALFIITVTVFAEGPEPDPWWMQVEKTQALALKWITAIGIVLTALVATGFTFMILIKGKLKELHDRDDRLAARSDENAKTITEVALNVPATKPSKSEP